MNKQLIVIIVITFLIGIFTGYKLYYDEPKPINIKPLPAIIQKDGSTVVEVIDTVIKIEQVIPKGYTRTKYVEITVAPDTIVTVDTVTVGDTIYITKTNSCGEVTVEISFIKNKKDNTNRVVVTTQDGTLVASKDIPIDDEKPYKPLKWCAGVAGRYDIIDSTPAIGGFIDRDVGPFSFGVDVVGWKSDITVGAKLGVRF